MHAHPARLPPLLAPALALALAACSDEHVPPDGAVFPPDCSCTDITPPTSPCDACQPDQLCVQFFDGVCNVIHTGCQTRHPDCATGTACTAGCMERQCNELADPPFYRCDVAGCPGEDPAALHCYGP